jgi:hypothetical protein
MSSVREDATQSTKQDSSYENADDSNWTTIPGLLALRWGYRWQLWRWYGVLSRRGLLEW